jgi:predicted short-subunit dehydrogenase-like oxidoreductase (DUF2520 family)
MQSGSIAIAGAGRLAYSLSCALKNAGYPLVCILSDNAEEKQNLFKATGTPLIPFASAPENIDTLILAVPDRRIREKALQLCSQIQITRLIHCSGAVPMEILSDITPEFGVLYPLQSFTIGRALPFTKIPVLWESNSNSNYLQKLASDLSELSLEVASPQRAIIHTGAVFANNFTNLMITLAADFAASAGQKPDIYQPLVEETIIRLRTLHPLDAQTGPARRDDDQTIADHLTIIRKAQPELAIIYQTLSDLIKNKYLDKT